MFVIPGIVLFVLILLLGSVIFSFLNVVIYRLPRKENFLTGRSRCPSCGHTLSFLDMVPVLSWLILRKRCRYCGARISGRYAAVELLGALAAAGCALSFGVSGYAFLAFAMCCVLTCVGFIDYDTMEIPDGLNIAAAILGVLALFLPDGTLWYEHLIGMAVISLPMLILALLIPGAFGGGDIKLMAGCGLFLGWKNAILAFVIAVLIGGVWAAVLLAKKKKGRKEQMPFGPALCMGVAAAMFAGDLIIDLYVGKILGIMA